MTIALVTHPANEPVTLEEAKHHLRITHDHEDALIYDIVRAAREFTEFTTQTKFITQAWRQYEAELTPERCIALRVKPVQTIQNVTIYDGEGEAQILSPNSYTLQQTPDGQVLLLDQTVSSAACRNGLEIDLIAGMGDFGIDVPHVLRRAILMLFAHWYEFRGAVAPSDQPVSTPPGFEALTAAYRPVRLS